MTAEEAAATRLTCIECESGVYSIGDDVELWAYNGESWQGRIVLLELAKRRQYRVSSMTRFMKSVVLCHDSE